MMWCGSDWLLCCASWWWWWWCAGVLVYWCDYNAHAHTQTLYTVQCLGCGESFGGVWGASSVWFSYIYTLHLGRDAFNWERVRESTAYTCCVCVCVCSTYRTRIAITIGDDANDDSATSCKVRWCAAVWIELRWEMRARDPRIKRVIIVFVMSGIAVISVETSIRALISCCETVPCVGASGFLRNCISARVRLQRHSALAILMRHTWQFLKRSVLDDLHVTIKHTPYGIRCCGSVLRRCVFSLVSIKRVKFNDTHMLCSYRGFCEPACTFSP